MTSNSEERCTRHTPQRGTTHHDNYNTNEKKNNNDIVNRRHSLAHSNFRKAIYRSLSLSQENDEDNNISIRYIKYFIKIFCLCLVIILTGSLVRLIWPFHRHK